jgi:hypothetical protein
LPVRIIGACGHGRTIENDPAVKEHVSPSENDHAFDVRQHLKHIDATFERLVL